MLIFKQRQLHIKDKVISGVLDDSLYDIDK